MGIRLAARRAASITYLALVVCFLAAPRASAQNCMPDGLQGGTCCQPATITLPVFPAVTDRAHFVCFETCDVRAEGDVCIQLGAPRVAHLHNQPPIPSIYLIRLTIQTCSLNPRDVWNTNLRAQYSRNWLAAVETPGGPPDTEVWRFLVNGNLAPSAFLTQHFGRNRCVVPPCVSQFPKPHFWGYIDYARNCATGEWQASMALQHDCDAYEHNGSSDRPGTFHRDDSYAFVAPAAGFTANSATIPAAAGHVFQDQDAIRKNLWASLPNITAHEEPLVSGNWVQGASTCPCSAGVGTRQDVQMTVIGAGECNTQFQTIGGAPVPFVQKRIGQWSTGPGRYPGNQSLLMVEGVLQVIDGCTSGGTVEYVKGVATVGGYQAFRLSQSPLASQFVDLGSANRSPTNRLTVVGAKYISNFIFNINLQ
ncbi:MAG: hypothetical protein HYR85_23550 [Planctomycetes bacterium]|nr:hypothetical protein [Planctomycetota bacterium]MBI3847098.1 hypothetical protein [Planctomycetota bacterium]